MNRPSDSFSAASSSVWSNSSPGIGACVGPANAPAAPLPCHASVAAELQAEVEDRSLPDERVLLGLLARRLRLLEHHEHALAACRWWSRTRRT